MGRLFEVQNELMPKPEDKPLHLELAEKELLRAVQEWVVDATCSSRQLSEVEARLFKAAAAYVKAKQVSGTHKLGLKK